MAAAPPMLTPPTLEEPIAAGRDPARPSPVDGGLSTLSMAGSSEELAAQLVLRVANPADYALGDELARGGMGRIVAAVDLRHGRPVAIKEPIHDAPGLLLRFRREALITARLQHPAIVPIYEAGLWPDGRPFFVMRRVEGQALDRAIAARATLTERIGLVPTVVAVAEALAYAHARGVIHRDLKPHNVLVGAFGETVVIDWGLARSLTGDDPGPERGVDDAAAAGHAADGADSGLTRQGFALGTPAYMPPEQARGEVVDARADVYALGALLYHVLAGEPPYAATGTPPGQLLAQVTAGPPPQLAALAPGVPAELAAIVERAMARAPEARYRSAAELAADLRRFTEGRMVDAFRYTRATLLRRWLRAHRVAVAAALALVGATAAWLAVYVRGVAHEQARTEVQRRRAVVERERAEAEATRAGVQTRALLAEHGRQRLAAGRPLEAAPYLARAYQLGDDSVAVRAMLGAALPTIETPLVRHGAGAEALIAAAAFDDARAEVITAGWDGTVRAWDLDGHERRRWAGLGRQTALLRTRDGRLLVGDEQGGVREVDLASGRAGPPWPGPTALVLGLIESVDGRWIGASQASDQLVIWPGAGGAPALQLDGGGRPLGFVDDEVVASTTEELRVVPLRGGRPRVLGPVRGGAVTLLDDGSIVAGAADGYTWWPRAGRGRAATHAVGTPTALTRVPGAAEVVLLLRRGELRRVDARTGVVRWAVPTGTGTARELRVSDDGERVLIARSAGDLEVVDASTGTTLATLVGHDGEVFASRDSRAHGRVVSYGGDGVARVWRLDAVAPRSLVLPGAVELGFDHRGRVLARTRDGRVVGPGADAWSWPATVTALAVSADGVTAAVASAAGVELRDLDRPGSVRPVPGAAATLLSFAPDGTLLTVGEGLQAWRTTGTPTRLRAVELTRPDRLFALSSASWVGQRAGTAHLLDAGPRRPRDLVHSGWVASVAVTTGIIATGDNGGVIQLWGEDGTARARLVGPAGAITALAFTRDGARLVAGTGDGAVRVWDVARAQVVYALPRRQGVVQAVAIAPGGDQVASVDDRGQVLVAPIGLESRSPAAVTAVVAAGSALEVADDGQLRRPAR